MAATGRRAVRTRGPTDTIDTTNTTNTTDSTDSTDREPSR